MLARREKRLRTGLEKSIEEREANGIEDFAHSLKVVSGNNFGGQKQPHEALLVVCALEELETFLHSARETIASMNFFLRATLISLCVLSQLFLEERDDPNAVLLDDRIRPECTAHPDPQAIFWMDEDTHPSTLETSFVGW